MNYSYLSFDDSTTKKLEQVSNSFLYNIRGLFLSTFSSINLGLA